MTFSGNDFRPDIVIHALSQDKENRLKQQSHSPRQVYQFAAKRPGFAAISEKNGRFAAKRPDFAANHDKKERFAAQKAFLAAIYERETIDTST